MSYCDITSVKPGSALYIDVTKPPVPPYVNTGYCTRMIVDKVLDGGKVSMCAYVGPKTAGVPDCGTADKGLCYKYGLDQTRDPSLPLLCGMVHNVSDFSNCDKCTFCPTGPGPIT